MDTLEAREQAFLFRLQMRSGVKKLVRKLAGQGGRGAGLGGVPNRTQN